MSETKPKRRAAQWPVIVTVTLLVVFAVIFMIEFVTASLETPARPEALTSTTYLAEVTTLLTQADAARGEQLVMQTYECHTCHITGAGQIAPAFTGLGDRAASTHPPLQAAAYLYESILYPGAYVVEGFANAMPINYPNRLSDQDLGDIIAYLLAQ